MLIIWVHLSSLCIMRLYHKACKLILLKISLNFFLGDLAMLQNQLLLHFKYYFYHVFLLHCFLQPQLWYTFQACLISSPVAVVDVQNLHISLASWCHLGVDLLEASCASYESWYIYDEDIHTTLYLRYSNITECV